MASWLNKIPFRRPDIPTPTPETPKTLDIRKIATQTFPTNYGRSSVWTLNNEPKNPTATDFLDKIEGLNVGDVVTWKFGLFYQVVMRDTKLQLEKKLDQTPPK